MYTAGTVHGVMLFCRDQSLHHSMKTLTLIIILTLRIEANGEMRWAVTVPEEINAKTSSDVTIKCIFTHPPAKSADSVMVFWKIKEKIKPEINENDKFEFIYHPNNTWVKESFKNRVTFTGNVSKKDCSLKIQNIQNSDANFPLYMRLATGFDNYSFMENLVRIKINGVTINHTNLFTDIPLQFISTTAMTTEGTGQSTSIYMASIIPCVVVLIGVTLGFIFFKLRKRDVATITREPSGYYANFSRTPKTDAKNIEIPQKQEPFPDPSMQTAQSGPQKATIIEPVYGNILPNNHLMDHSEDDINNIYVNVDYLKP